MLLNSCVCDLQLLLINAAQLIRAKRLKGGLARLNHTAGVGVRSAHARPIQQTIVDSAKSKPRNYWRGKIADRSLQTPEAIEKRPYGFLN